MESLYTDEKWDKIIAASSAVLKDFQPSWNPIPGWGEKADYDTYERETTTASRGEVPPQLRGFDPSPIG